MGRQWPSKEPSIPPCSVLWGGACEAHVALPREMLQGRTAGAEHPTSSVLASAVLYRRWPGPLHWISISSWNMRRTPGVHLTVRFHLKVHPFGWTEAWQAEVIRTLSSKARTWSEIKHPCRPSQRSKPCCNNLYGLNWDHFGAENAMTEGSGGLVLPSSQAAGQDLANYRTLLLFQVQGLPRPSSLPSALRLHAAVLACLSSAVGFHYCIWGQWPFRWQNKTVKINQISLWNFFIELISHSRCWALCVSFCYLYCALYSQICFLNSHRYLGSNKKGNAALWTL